MHTNYTKIGEGEGTVFASTLIRTLANLQLIRRQEKQSLESLSEPIM